MPDERKSPASLNASVERLLHNVQYGLDHGFAPRAMIPMLQRLESRAAPGSALWAFAVERLTEQHLVDSPWQAALYARRLLDAAETDAAWALLGLAHARSGHIRAAVRAFRRALALLPGCPSYSHNVGHLLDAGLGRTAEALPHLARAAAALPDDAEVVASYAHALVRSGQASRAETLLARVLPGGAAEARQLVARFSRSRHDD
ncbi:MAG: tetratricopeptide repeat protein [Polyangiaceae bacterium]